MDLNKVMLIGRLIKDPEARTTPTSVNVTSFVLATKLMWTDQAGTRQEKSEFHNVVAWRKLGEICAQYLRKGARIYLEGRIQTHSWDDQTGNKRYRTEILADNMIMLDTKNTGTPANNSGEPSYQPVAGAAPTTSEAEEEVNVEEIPF